MSNTRCSTYAVVCKMYLLTGTFLWVGWWFKTKSPLAHSRKRGGFTSAQPPSARRRRWSCLRPKSRWCVCERLPLSTMWPTPAPVSSPWEKWHYTGLFFTEQSWNHEDCSMELNFATPPLFRDKIPIVEILQHSRVGCQDNGLAIIWNNIEILWTPLDQTIVSVVDDVLPPSFWQHASIDKVFKRINSTHCANDRHFTYPSRMNRDGSKTQSRALLPNKPKIHCYKGSCWRNCNESCNYMPPT